MKKAGPPQTTPSIGVEIYDTCTPDDKISPVVSVNTTGEFTIKYKTRCPDVCDMEDPLSMSVARDYGLGIEIGMVMARIDMVVEGEAVEKYRVIFSDGEGYLTNRDRIEYMRDLFVNTPGLEPIVVLVIGS